MRMFRWMVLAVATILPAAPAIAQRYDPNYPVCMYVGKPDGNYINCSYTSWDQCRASASGRAAMCLDNPHLVARPSGFAGRPASTVSETTRHYHQ
jgi:Protein of unknown function (DUF3551)